jgi:RNA 2',3'-cyclic 3'-phosphodiesterase
MRLFVAVAVPAEVAGELDSAVAPHRAAWPDLRWTGCDAWHLTLAFLGEVTETVSGRLMPRLERAAARHSWLSLSLAGAGAFPDATRARVVWTGVQGDLPSLGRLADSVAARARRAGVTPPGGASQAGARPARGRRRFAPHLTLARCRAPVDVEELVAKLGEHAGPPWTAREIYLIRSYLPGTGRGGAGHRDNGQPRYETLGSWPLRLPAAPGPGS